MADILKEMLDEVEAKVDAYGWTPIAVHHDDEGRPPYAYSVGFERTFGVPEIVLIGFEPRMMQGLIAEVADGLKARRLAFPVEGGRMPEVIRDFDVLLRPVPEAARLNLSRFAHAAAMPNTPRLMQLVLPDAEGRFPGEPGCDEELVRFQDPAPFEG